MSKILISYRQKDSADVTGRIYDRLREEFGPEAVFKDVDSIPLGVDFRIYLDEQVACCDVFLAVIGRDWIRKQGTKAKSRLDDPEDFVRIEIESALKRRIPVIPVLVRGASIPSASKLPISIQELTYRNGITVRPDPDFHRDMDRLSEAVKGHIQGHENLRTVADAEDQNAVPEDKKFIFATERVNWLLKGLTGVVLFLLIGAAVWLWPKAIKAIYDDTFTTMVILGAILLILVPIAFAVLIVWQIKGARTQAYQLGKIEELLESMAKNKGNISSGQRTQFINAFHQAQNELNQLDDLRRQQSELRLGDMRAEAASMGIFLD